MDLIINIIGFFLLLGVGFWLGGVREKRHYQNIIDRERQLAHISTRVDHLVYDNFNQAKMVYGSVVVANDFFKSTLAGLRHIFGGRISSYESLLDRARREAVLRLKEQASAWSAEEIVHLRLLSSRIGQGGVEILATGTALKK